MSIALSISGSRALQLNACLTSHCRLRRWHLGLAVSVNQFSVPPNEGRDIVRASEGIIFSCIREIFGMNLQQGSLYLLTVLTGDPSGPWALARTRGAGPGEVIGSPPKGVDKRREVLARTTRLRPHSPEPTPRSDVHE